MRPYQVATAAVMILIAAVAMFDSRASALPETTIGRYPGGLGPGFYPFWSAALIAGAAVVVAYSWYRRTNTGPGIFDKREAWTAPLKIAVPMIVAVAFIEWLGFYIVTGLYMAFFAWFIGRYRWFWVVAVAIVFPVVIYLSFERGFRVFLPKSVFYEQGFPF